MQADVKEQHKETSDDSAFITDTNAGQNYRN